jgi:FkbM family methyltransferase
MNSPSYLKSTLTYPRFTSIPSFAGTKLCRYLKSQPLTGLDVGGRGGVHPVFLPLIDLIQLVFVEPDPGAATELSELLATHHPSLDYKILDFALGSCHKKATLYQTADPAASSLYRPSCEFVNRYHVTPAQPTSKKVDVIVHALDEILHPGSSLSSNIKQGAGIEIIKADIQGSELDMLRGAQNILSRSTLAIFCEVGFFKLYEQQPLFSEIELYLRSLGFSFYGFDSIHLKSARRHNKAVAPIVKERYYWADAVFIRDPFDSSTGSSFEWNERSLFSIFIIAALLGYADLACEVLDHSLLNAHVDEDERSSLFLFLEEIASARRDNLISEVESLYRQVLKDSNPVRSISRFVDSWRFLADHLDSPKPNL